MQYKRYKLYVYLIIALQLVSITIFAQNNITRVEYYVDIDPGFGNATAINLNVNTDLANLNIAIDPAVLNEGAHRVLVRAQNTNGNWGHTNTWLFYKPYGAGGLPILTNPSNITNVEYYVDIDPGFGNATNLPIAAGTDFQNLMIPIDQSTLKEGVHRFMVRARNADGGWGLNNTLLFYKPYNDGFATNMPAVVNIKKIEYYVDTDPGFDRGVAVALPATTELSNYLMPINATGLAVGTHNLWVRALDKNGKWGMVNGWPFTVPATLAAPAIVVNGVSKKVTCASDSFDVSYDKSGTYNNGNIFNVELSDASGSFAIPTIIGSYAGTENSIIHVGTPATLHTGYAYRVRVSSTSPVVTGVVGNDSLTIHDWSTGAVVIGLPQDTTVYHTCLGETSNLLNVYNTTGLNAVWNTTNTTAAPPGIYKLIVTSNAGCADTAIATVVLEIATWTGTTNDEWHTASNWSTGKVPTEHTHVIVATNSPNTCTISTANAKAISVQVRNGATIKTINSKKLDINGNCRQLPD